MIIHICTSNPGKLREIREAGEAFVQSQITLEPLPGLKDIAAPEETGSSFEENARAKAEYYSRFSTEAVLADDSGLEVGSLGGAPGIYSARYAGPDASDAANNALLLRNLHGASNRACRFVCVIALAQCGVNLHLFAGTVEGLVLESERGTSGFGYDPLFFYPPLQKSFAELDRAEKLQVSHRGRALQSALRWLLQRKLTNAALQTASPVL